MRVTVSETGVGHGWGRDPWNWVNGLTADERAAVRAGEIVLIAFCPKAGSTWGTTLRQVVFTPGGHYIHRVPSDEILAFVGEADPLMERGKL